MLTIKEIFDICKEHDVFIDLSYFNLFSDPQVPYMIKLYYGKKRQYRLLNALDLEYIYLPTVKALTNMFVSSLRKQKRRKRNDNRKGSHDLRRIFY